MKEFMDWFDEKVLSNRKTAIVGFIGLGLVDWLFRGKLPYALLYILYILVGVIGLVSVLRAWTDNKKLQIIFAVVCAALILFGAVDFFGEIRQAPTSAPQRSSQQYVESTPTRSNSGGQSGGSSGSSAYSGGSATGFSGWSGSSAKTCPICNGRKTCDVCGGLKSCQFTYGTNPCMNGKLRINGQTFTCSSCNGSGKCKYCSGTGKCTYCDGTGTI